MTGPHRYYSRPVTGQEATSLFNRSRITAVRSAGLATSNGTHVVMLHAGGLGNRLKVLANAIYQNADARVVGSYYGNMFSSAQLPEKIHTDDKARPDPLRNGAEDYADMYTWPPKGKLKLV